jgi:hypothetical protein
MHLCHLRSNGTTPEDQIARQLDFRDALDAHSVEAMYEELESWELPSWVVYPHGADERAQKEVKKREGKERKARGTGDVEELPPAGRAEKIFRQDLERLSYYIGELSGLKEQLQARRFVSSFWVGEDSEYYDKREFSEEQWRELCEKHGEDPSVLEIRIPIDPIKPGGASSTPWEGLVPLLAMHAIMYGTVDDLIEVLHPNPSSVDKANLYKERGIVNFLQTYAVRLARTVRGAKVHEGQLPPGVSSVDHWVAWFLIAPLAEAGYSDEQIHAHIENKYGPWERRYTVADVTRLRRLRLPPPDRVPPEDLP